MFDKKVSELLNDQTNRKLYSAYLRLDFSPYHQEQGLNGFANWYMIQTREEHDYAILLLQYLQNDKKHITLKQVDKPDKICSALKDPLESALEHERYVTSLVHTIYDTAHEVKDYHTMQLLDWLVEEQGEEEKDIEDMVKKSELPGADPKSLYMPNNEMTGRTHSTPSLVL